MKVVLPLYVDLPRVRTKPKRVWLNLNTYRNAPYQLLNDMKVNYKQGITTSLLALHGNMLSQDQPIELTYTVFPKTRRKFDLSNVLSIVQKFTDDALVDLGLIKDDDYTIVRSVIYRFGEVDKENPRVELEIDEYQKEIGRPA